MEGQRNWDHIVLASKQENLQNWINSQIIETNYTEKKIDENYTRMLCTAVNKSWK